MSEWARGGELEVFATGTTAIVHVGGDEPDPARGDDAGTTAELLRRTGAAMLDIHARPGHRPGRPIVIASARRGGDTDIVRSVLIHPAIACRVATSGRLFRDPIDGFDVNEADDADDDRRFLVWHAALSGSHVSRIPVSLHVLASPSLVVTVLEIIPQRPLRWKRDGFVRDGIDVIDRVAARLTRLCVQPAAA
jgi:hypothetical protein